MVHSAWMRVHAAAVALEAEHLASGHGDRRPIATGMAKPIEPPVLVIQSCGAALRSPAIRPRPEVTDSSTTMRVLGQAAAAITAAMPGKRERPGRRRLPLQRLAPRHGVAGAEAFGQPPHRVGAVFRGRPA